MNRHYRFTPMEFSGSLGDLGALLPIAIAMILISGLDPVGLFATIGLYFIFSGIYFGVTVPVQPMKVIGAYAIATAMEPSRILASCLLMAAFLFFIGVTGSIDYIQRYTPKAAIRGVQLSTGALLIAGGVKFIMGTSKFQELQGLAEPVLAVQNLGPVPVSLVFGIASCILLLFFLNSKRFPAALIVVSLGFAGGLLLGVEGHTEQISIGFTLPELLPFPFPVAPDYTFALFALVLPQLPMTMGNAVLAYTDLSHKYFGKQASRISNKAVCISMALANAVSFCLGGMPLCHGAGGLAAHYRFGARTPGSNIIIGGIFLVCAVVFGRDVVHVFALIPLSVLGALLIFAGAQLTLTIMDLTSRTEYFVATMILGITLASNLAVGFVVGLLLARLLRWKRLSV